MAEIDVNEQQYSTDEKKALKEIRRKHILGWTFGLGGGVALGLFGVNWVWNAIAGTAGMGNSIANILLSAGPLSGAGFVVAGVIGALIGNHLGKDKQHVQEHIKKKMSKEKDPEKKSALRRLFEKLGERKTEKNKIKEQQQQPVEVHQDTEILSQNLVVDRKNVVTIKNMKGEVLSQLHETDEKEASPQKGNYCNKMQLGILLGNSMPQEDCVVEYNGETVAGFKVFNGEGTTQTVLNENMKSWKRKVVDIVTLLAYGKDEEMVNPAGGIVIAGGHVAQNEEGLVR